MSTKMCKYLLINSPDDQTMAAGEEKKRKYLENLFVEENV
jgi:hypothetical protein